VTGVAQLESWAREGAAQAGLDWREYLAGATGSVLCLHALIAAAGEVGTTAAQAEQLDRAYLSIGAITTLDSLLDRAQYGETGQLGFLEHYGDADRLGRAVRAILADAVERISPLPHEAHHTMTMAGVAAYYLSAPAADEELARPAVEHVRQQLGPLLGPALWVMAVWRRAKHVRAGLRARGPRIRGGAV
jgi:hypothetical protein